MSDQTPRDIPATIETFETEHTGYWINDAQLDALGRLADTCENYAGASKLPLPPAMHVEQMRRGFEEIAQNITRLYQAIRGDEQEGC